METKIEVPSQVRELVAISIDNIEKAFGSLLRRRNKIDCTELA